MAALGFSRFVTKSHGEQPAIAVHREVTHLEGRAAPGPQSLPGEIQQVGRPRQAQPVIGERYREQQRRDAERGGQHVHQETQAHAPE